MDGQVQAAAVAAATALVTSLLTYRQMRNEFALQRRADSLVRRLLKARGWELRSFKAIEKRVSGFDEHQLRRILIRAGAVRFERVSDGEEMWGLVERNRARLGIKPWWSSFWPGYEVPEED